jgi:hypothetical protein
MEEDHWMGPLHTQLYCEKRKNIFGFWTVKMKKKSLCLDKQIERPQYQLADSSLAQLVSWFTTGRKGHSLK